MPKFTRYFLILAATLLSTVLILGLVYFRYVYTGLVLNNEDKFPEFAVRIIDRLANREPRTPKITPKLEDTIQILEGWTNRDIGLYLKNLEKWSDEELEKAGFFGVDSSYHKAPSLKNWSTEYPLLFDGPKYYGLEGYLFPDTYRIYASSTIEVVVIKMLDNFNSKLTPKMRADIKAQGKTIHSIITMASIIEKEAPIDYLKEDNRDAKIISGIFWNRLKIGQGLQSDATLSYIFNDNKTQHSGKELEIDSLYNTYRYRGLPPAPICSPGLLAIEAAIYPIASDYYFFLSPKGKDTVIYARDFEEHKKNVNKYLR